MSKPKHTRSPEFTPPVAAPEAAPDALDAAVTNAIATVKADIAKAANGNLTTDPAASPKKKAAKALKAAKEAKEAKAQVDAMLTATVATIAEIEALPPLPVLSSALNEAQLEKVSTTFLKPKPNAADVPPHLDPESGLWIPKNPNAGKPKEPKEPKAPKPPKEKKPLKPLKEVAGQPSRGPNSTTAVVSMKVPLKTALAKAATSNMRSLSAQAALYILEGLKRDGIIQDNPPMTEAKAAE